MKWCIQTTNEEQTIAFGKKLGRLLMGGEVIELVSDVGGGKTTLTKGIVAGIGAKDPVTSPTFTVSKVYKTDRLDLHHYDFYRLGEIGLMSEELQEVIHDQKAVTVIEWAGSAHDQLPADRLITIVLGLVANNLESRVFKIELPDKFSEWVDELGVQLC